MPKSPPIPCKPEETWLSRLGRLNVAPDRGDGRGCAPHKPLLLLAMMQMVADGHLSTPRLELSADLVFRFQNFWPIVEPRRGNKGDATMPFHALGPQRDGIWAATLASDDRPSTSRDTTKCVIIDPELWSLLQAQDFRRRAATCLISTYFPAQEQVALFLACDLPFPSGAELAALMTRTLSDNRLLETGRNARFRGQIITGYYFTCALTGYRLTTSSGAFIVEAAHIRPVAKKGPNERTNGLALTPDSHWMFDEGLWTLDDHYRIMIAGKQHFADSIPAPGMSLRDYDGRQAHFDPRTPIRPAAENLLFHREQVFRGR